MQTSNRQDQDRAAPRLLRLAPEDNVAVAVVAIAAGETVVLEGRPVTAAQHIPAGHKLAVAAIAAGQKVVKYGLPIGSATCAIDAGCHVHTHNLKSDHLPEGEA